MCYHLVEHTECINFDVLQDLYIFQATALPVTLSQLMA